MLSKLVLNSTKTRSWRWTFCLNYIKIMFIWTISAVIILFILFIKRFNRYHISSFYGLSAIKKSSLRKKITNRSIIILENWSSFLFLGIKIFLQKMQQEPLECLWIGIMNKRQKLICSLWIQWQTLWWASPQRKRYIYMKELIIFSIYFPSKP